MGAVDRRVDEASHGLPRRGQLRVVGHQRNFVVLAPFFFNEALLKFPSTYPLTD